MKKDPRQTIALLHSSAAGYQNDVSPFLGAFGQGSADAWNLPEPDYLS